MASEWLLLLDVETTGLDPKRDVVVELGMALYSTQHGLVSCASTLVKATNTPDQVHGIPPDALQFGINPRLVRSAVERFCQDRPITYVAHNAEFERSFLTDIPSSWGGWICTQLDAEWPVSAALTSRSLVQIALALGVGVARAHRAIDDVLTLAAMLDRVREVDPELAGWLAVAREERVTFVSNHAFEDNDAAKSAGFMWESGPKRWTRRVRVSQVDATMAALRAANYPGRVSQVTEPTGEDR